MANLKKIFAASPTDSDDEEADPMLESSQDYCFLFSLLCKTLVNKNEDILLVLPTSLYFLI